MDFKSLYDRVLRDTTVDVSSLHGPTHWARVERNGIYLCQFTLADPVLVRLFAIFHDSMRRNDHDDPPHGARAADYAETLRGDFLDIGDEDFEVLDYALRWHTGGTEADNETVAVCWDSDRLDLGRVAVTPNARFLFSEEAQRIAEQRDFDCLEDCRPSGLTHLG